MFSIWTFDVVTKRMPYGSKEPSTYTAPVLFEDCRPECTKDDAVQRAAFLTIKHGRGFIVRSRDANGTYPPIDGATMKRGITEVAAAVSEKTAIAHKKRMEKKIRDSGYRG